MPNNSIRKTFGSRIKKLRLATGMTQESFADHCGFARTYMSRLETGGANPSLDAINTIATALNVPLKDLFDGL